MYQKPQQPQTIGRVLDSGFQLYRAKFMRIVILALLGGLAPFAMSIVSFLTISADGSIGLGFYAVQFLATVISFVFYLGILHALLQTAAGAPSTMGRNLAVGADKIIWVFLATICFALAVTVGLALLIIPGIFLMVAFSMYALAIIDEDDGPIASLRSSYRLIKGHWWRTAVVFTVISFIVMALYLVVFFVVGAAFGLGGGALIASGTGQEADLAIGLYFGAVLLQLLLGALLGPVFYAVMVVLYNDLRLRKSGSDLDSRIDEAGTA